MFFDEMVENTIVDSILHRRSGFIPYNFLIFSRE